MDDIVGKLNYRGDIRTTGGREVIYLPRHGVVRPVMAEYDEAADRTTVSYIPLLEGQTEIVNPGEESLSVAYELQRRKRANDAALVRMMKGGA